MEGEIAADGVFQLNGAAMGAAAALTPSEHGEPAFDLIEPRGRGRGDVKAWIAYEPSFNGGSLVSTVVVHLTF